MFNIIGISSISELMMFTSVALAVPGSSIHLYGKTECRKGPQMGHVTVVADSDAQLRARPRPLLTAISSGSCEEADLYAPLPLAKGFSSTNPFSSIHYRFRLGSACNAPRCPPVRSTYELTMVSAHRTPDRIMMVEYARSAVSPADDHCRGRRGSPFTWDGCCHDCAACDWRACRGEHVGWS
jgi:phosphoribosylaminoimidazole carboxylase